MPMDQVADQARPPKRPSRLFGQYIINTHFQFKFSLVVLFFLASVAFFVWIEGTMAIKNMVATGAVVGDEAIAQLNLLNSIIGKTLILGLAVTFGLSLFFSHFVAGPIYRFQKTLQEMRDGKLNIHVQLRKNDELKDIADLFNQALSSLRNRLRKERDGITASTDKMQELVARLRKAGRADDANELDQLITEVKNNPPQISL